MKLMVFEPGFRGHYLQYAGRILRAAAYPGVDITFVSSAAAVGSEEFRQHIGSLVPKLDIRAPVMHQHEGSVTAFWWQRARGFVEAVRQVRPDHIIIPYADGLIQMLAVQRAMGFGGVLRGIETEAIVLRGSFGYNAQGAAYAKARVSEFLVARSPVQRLRVLDGVVYDRIKARQWARGKSLLAVPDFCDPLPPMSKAAARAALGLGTEGELVVCAGAMDTRKGFTNLVQAFAAAQAARPGLRLMLAGTFSPGIADDLRRSFAPLLRTGRLMVTDRFLGERDLNAAVCAADLVAAAYLNHMGTSGIVSRAVGNDRPVLTHDRGWCGAMVPQLQLGMVLDPTDAERYPAKLVAALDLARQWRPSAAAERLKVFWSPANFDRLCVKRLRERLGLPPEEVVFWESVTLDS